MTSAKILSLFARNFGGLRDGDYRFRATNRRGVGSVAIVGKRAAGKTSLLRALLTVKELVAPYAQTPSLLTHMRQAGRPISLEVWVAISDESGLSEQRVLFEQGGPEPIREVPTALASLFSRYEHGAPGSKVDYFPADRYLPSWPRAASRPRSALAERAQRLSGDPTKYASVWPWLIDALSKERVERDAATQSAGFSFVDDANALLKRLQEGMAKLDAGARIAGLSAAGEPLFQTQGGAVVSVEGLSTSARHALLFVLSYQMVQHQRSIILIDEPERGCAPVDAVARFEGLVALGGDSQLIVATNLPAIAECADVVVEVAS